MNTAHIVHERTLLGAIDSFMGGLVHVRPHLAADYRDQLEALSDSWLETGGANSLDALTPEWLEQHLNQVDDRETAQLAIDELFSWAKEQHLL